MSRKRVAEEKSTRIDLLDKTSRNREGEAVGMESESVLTLALPGEMMPPTLHVLPVSERPFFPGQMSSLMVPEGPGWRRSRQSARLRTSWSPCC